MIFLYLKKMKLLVVVQEKSPVKYRTLFQAKKISKIFYRLAFGGHFKLFRQSFENIKIRIRMYLDLRRYR